MAKVGLNSSVNVGGFFSERKKSKSTGSVRAASNNSPSPFQVLLDELGYKERKKERTLESIFLDLGEAEKSLLDLPGAENVGKYKALISEIINKILKENSKIVKQRTNTAGLEFTTIRIIHKKLDYLARGLTSQIWENNIRKTNPAFELLKTMGDIRGLLVNLRT